MAKMINYCATVDDSYGIHIKRACLINGIDLIQRGGSWFFHHPLSDEKVLVKMEVSEDDYDTLMAFIQELIGQGEL